jgi:hypothetical protein
LIVAERSEGYSTPDIKKKIAEKYSFTASVSKLIDFVSSCKLTRSLVVVLTLVIVLSPQHTMNCQTCYHFEVQKNNKKTGQTINVWQNRAFSAFQRYFYSF